MTKFEAQLREKIAENQRNLKLKNLYKLILGEWQKNTAFSQGSDEIGFNIVRGVIKANEENLGYLKKDDPRYNDLVEENKVLEELMPNFLTAEEIVEEMKNAALDQVITSAKSSGQAMGMVMKHFKSKDLPVDGNIVKGVVENLREESK